MTTSLATQFVRQFRLTLGVAAGLVVLLTTTVFVAMALALRADRARERADRERVRAEEVDRASSTALKYVQDNVLAAVRSAGSERGAGLGHNATIRAAIDAAEPGIGGKLAQAPLAEASVRDVLGTTYLNLRDYTNAVRQYQRALELWKAHPATDPNRSLATLNNLASSYHRLNQVDRAVPLYEELMRIRKVTLGPRHEETLASMYNLAIAYRNAGRSNQSLQLHEQTLSLRQAVLGPGHPTTLTSMIVVGDGYRRAGRTNDAIALLEEVLKHHHTSLGTNGSLITDCVVTLARTYEAAGRFQDALPLRRLTYELDLAQRGPRHEYTRSSRQSLARAYSRIGLTNEALALLAPSSEGSPSVSKAQGTNAAARPGSSPPPAAGASVAARAQVPTILQQMAAARRSVGHVSAETETNVHNLARLLEDAHAYAEAEQLYDELIASRRAHLDSTNALLVATLSDAGQLHTERGWIDQRAHRTNSAVRHARQAVEYLREGVAGSAYLLAHDSSLLGGQARLGGALILAGTADAALAGSARLALFVEAESLLLECRTRLPGTPLRPDTLRGDIDRRLARLYTQWDAAFPEAGKSDLAREWQNKLRPPSGDNASPAKPR